MTALSLLRLVPRLYRAAEVAVAETEPGTAMPPVPAFLRFGSWIGGDRDGNPFVTADVTRQTVAIQAEHALRTLAASVDRVGRTLTLDADEFLRRFLVHVLPKRFVRIRYFGFLAPRCRTRELAQCRQALAVAPTPPDEPLVTSRPSWPCPRCGAPMRLVERLTARQLALDALLVTVFHDTS